MHALAQQDTTARQLGRSTFNGLEGQMQGLQGAAANEGSDAELQGVSLASLLSSDLLQGQKVVSIRHNGSVYRLQATRLGKLILTK